MRRGACLPQRVLELVVSELVVSELVVSELLAWELLVRGVLGWLRR